LTYAIIDFRLNNVTVSPMTVIMPVRNEGIKTDKFSTKWQFLAYFDSMTGVFMLKMAVWQGATSSRFQISKFQDSVCPAPDLVR
jgi:hypothetical protein